MKIEPPKAEKIPFKHEIHGDIRIDNYYWLNERDNEKVIDYLNNENSYTTIVPALIVYRHLCIHFNI